jgi:hypothetical protein
MYEIPAWSPSNKSLQVADFVAWSAGKKLRGDGTYWDILTPKIACYEVIAREYWD